MNKGAPVSSKLLNKKWILKEQLLHKKKLKDIKPMIDIQAPNQYQHLKIRNKKERLIEGKERELF